MKKLVSLVMRKRSSVGFAFFFFFVDKKSIKRIRVHDILKLTKLELVLIWPHMFQKFIIILLLLSLFFVLYMKGIPEGSRCWVSDNTVQTHSYQDVAPTKFNFCNVQEDSELRQKIKEYK